MKKRFFVIFLAIFGLAFAAKTSGALVIQSDFGLKDGAVSEMQGIAFGVDKNLKIFNLTHEIPAYNIWEAAYRLLQSASYWPAGTVFVSVVDPGVGTDRKSIVLLTKTGHFFVSPDNGTLGLIAEKLGISAVRQIDETKNRLKGSRDSYTFHGRDVYSYTGALLASGKINFEGVGKKLPSRVIEIAYQKPTLENGVLKGNIPVLDVQYGNIWTNIPKKLFDKLGVTFGEKLCVKITQRENGQTIEKFSEPMPYARSFGDVAEGAPLLYLNSLLNVSFALNVDSFAEKHGISSGPDWSTEIQKCK